MTRARVGGTTLNAYVDGELPAAAAAEVARAAADDPAIAARIASLREMKAAIADLSPDRRLALPEAPRRPRALALGAAGLLAAAVIAGLLFMGVPGFDSRPDWPTVLESHHRSWAFNRTADAVRPTPAAVAAEEALPRLDLSSARLTLVGREQITHGALTLERLGYEGSRGCRLSLFRLPGELNIAGDAFAPPLRVRVWRQQQHEYLLMGDGMDESRFEELAKAIENALRNRHPIDAETRQRLAKARELSRPCRA